MSGTIHVELARARDADHLIEFLATRGLTGALTCVNDHCEIEVGYTEDPELCLRRDFEAALGSWLEDHERPLIPVSDHQHDYVLRPPAD